MAEENQFFKYLRYALGEVILVVVGILIALQINNWNEARKDAQKKDFHLQALQNDLRKDTAQIGRFIREIDRYTPVYNKLKSAIEKEDSSTDGLIQLFVNDPTFTPKLDPQNNSALSSLLSTGELKIFEAQESAAFLDFYKEMEDPYDFINGWYEVTDQVNTDMWNDYGWLSKDPSKWFMYERARASMDEVEFAKAYDVYVTRKDFWFPVVKEISEELLNKTNQMLEKVNAMRKP